MIDSNGVTVRLTMIDSKDVIVSLTMIDSTDDSEFNDDRQQSWK